MKPEREFVDPSSLRDLLRWLYRKLPRQAGTSKQEAGVPGRIPHDFGRTAVRNLERAGVPRSTAMKMVGHKTESIYRRYAIVTESDLREAAGRIQTLHDQQVRSEHHRQKKPSQLGTSSVTSKRVGRRKA
jgi:integrase